MHWSIYSGVMFFSSVAYYLFVRRVQKLGITRQTYMLANFLLPAFLYFILILIQRRNLIISPSVLIIALITGIVFNYLGSIWGYIGIEKAPNTGYSVIIQKSYAIYTSIAAVLLFGAHFTLTKFLLILLVIFFTSQLVIDPSQTKKTKRPFIGEWALFSVGAFFLFGNISLAAKMAAINGADMTVYLFWVIVFTLILSLIGVLRAKNKLSLKFSKRQLFAIVFMGIFVSIFYFSKNLSDINAPNVGYSSAVNASSNALLTIMSAYLYKEHLSLKKFLAAFGSVFCIGLLIFA